ncbi:MAG: hypothetical protein F6K47_42135 [Symploca sp. SIO2E6]|nr:hypothetical protein [Symploca sp. SIO2E6]
MNDSSELFNKLVRSRQDNLPASEKKRGRPPTGKRSNPDWISRNFYIQKETDLEVETQLLKLKHLGHNLDKSELVDALLVAWVKWQKGENSDFQLGGISPRQK